MAKNNISTLAFKRDRVLAKLDLAKARRQGRTVVFGIIAVDASNDTVFDITKESLGAVTPQVGWSLTTGAGTGAITNVEDLSTVLWRITYDGPAASPDAGDVVTIISTEDENALFFRERNDYDISQLPTIYAEDSNDTNSVVDNPNEGGLVLGRPWIT